MADAARGTSKFKTNTNTLPSIPQAENNEMKHLVEKLQTTRQQHEDGIKYMDLRKLRELVSEEAKSGSYPLMISFVSFIHVMLVLIEKEMLCAKDEE